MADNLPFFNNVDQFLRNPWMSGKVAPTDRPPGGIPEDNLTEQQKLDLLNQYGGSFQKMPTPSTQADLAPFSKPPLSDIPWLNMQNVVADISAGKPAQSAAQPQVEAPIPEIAPKPMFAGSGGAGGSSTGGMDPDMREIMKKQIEGLNLQKQGIANLEADKAKIPNGAAGMDMTGLMMLADQWGDKNAKVFTGSYKAPQTAEEREALKRALELQIQKAKQGLTDDEVNHMKAQLSAKLMHQSTLADKQQRDLERWVPTIIDKYNKDDLVKKYSVVKASAQDVLDNVQMGNPLGDSAIPTFLTRASGEVGALTEADKRPFGGSQALKSRIKAIYEKAKSGKMTDENRAFVRQLAQAMNTRSQAHIDDVARKMSEQYGRARTGVAPDQILGVIAPHLEYRPLMKGSSSGVPQGEYPKQVTNAKGEVATVNNAAEAKEALDEGGFK